MNENILGTENISKLFIKYSLPAIISMLIGGLQTVIDGLFIGNVLGPDGMASINIASPFVSLIIALSMIVSIGSQSYMGISLGTNDIKKTQDTFKTSIIIIVVIGLATTFLGLFLNKQLSQLLGASTILISDVSTYIRTISIFTIPMCLMFLFGFSGRINENPQLYFYGSILSLIVNIILNYLLIYKLSLGVLGAAIATGVAYSSALFIVILPMLNKKSVLNIFDGSFNKKTIIPIIYNGSSEGVTSLSTAITTYLFNMAFMSIAGETGVASFTAINYIGQFGILLMFGVSDGIGPLISYNYGSENFNRIKSTMWLSYKVLISIGITVFCILFFFGSKLITVFIGNNETILQIANAGSKIYAFSFFMCGFNIVNSGFFTYIGKATISVLIAACRGLIFIPIGIFILPLLFGTNGIWMAIPFAEFITLVIGFIFIKKYYALLI